VNATPHNAEQPNSKYPHVYAVVRFDLDVDRSSIEQSATVVKILPSRVLAEQEASRLSKINRGKRCVYTVQTTRFIGTF